MSCVYFVQAGPVRGYGLVKIGRTKNVRSRMAELQVGCPVDLNLIAHIEVGAYSPTVERQLHERFSAFRRPHSEWFSPHPSIFTMAYSMARIWFDLSDWEAIESLVAMVDTPPFIDDLPCAFPVIGDGQWPEEHW